MATAGIKKAFFPVLVLALAVSVPFSAFAQSNREDQQEKMLKQAATELIKINFKLEKAKEETMKGNYRKALSLVDDAEANFNKIEGMIKNSDADKYKKDEALEGFSKIRSVYIDGFRSAIKDLMRE